MRLCRMLSWQLHAGAFEGVPQSTAFACLSATEVHDRGAQLERAELLNLERQLRALLPHINSSGVFSAWPFT